MIDEKDYGGNSNLYKYVPTAVSAAVSTLALAFTSCQPPAAEAFDPAQQ